MYEDPLNQTCLMFPLRSLIVNLMWHLKPTSHCTMKYLSRIVHHGEISVRRVQYPGVVPWLDSLQPWCISVCSDYTKLSLVVADTHSSIILVAESAQPSSFTVTKIYIEPNIRPNVIVLWQCHKVFFLLEFMFDIFRLAENIHQSKLGFWMKIVLSRSWLWLDLIN